MDATGPSDSPTWSIQHAVMVNTDYHSSKSPFSFCFFFCVAVIPLHVFRVCRPEHVVNANEINEEYSKIDRRDEGEGVDLPPYVS